MMNTVFLGFVQNHVSQASRCLCKGGLDDMPCWRCSRTACEVYWVARFAEPPIRVASAMPMHPASTASWYILTPTTPSGPTMTSYRKEVDRIQYQTRTPARLTYCKKTHIWMATNHKYTRTGTSLRLTLLKFRKAVKLRRFY